MGKLIKKTADRIISGFALLIFAPVILVITVAILWQMGSPILFTQPRPGKDGIVFKFYKFRTMTDTRNSSGELLADEKRLTLLGKLLRKTSLDELPQLWHVLKGEMSFVGPRPLLVHYLELYNEEQARRHEVLPGITGWAQVNGRRNLDGDFTKKFQLDVWYIDHWSLWLDLKILWLTILTVVMQKDVDQDGYTAGGGKFTGNK